MTKICVSNNHHENGTGTNLDRCEEVQRLIDIYPEEVDTIETMALGAHSGMSAVKKSLVLHYSKREFDKQLVLNIINKKRDKVYRKGRHQIRELMHLGSKANSTGGV